MKHEDEVFDKKNIERADLYAEFSKEKREHEERYGQYKDPSDKLATVFKFKPVDTLWETFYFAIKGVNLSLPYPTLATFNHIVNISPKEPTKDSMSLWAFYAVWILVMADKKSDEWLSFRVSYETKLAEVVSEDIAQTSSTMRMKRDIKKSLPIFRRKHVDKLYEGFIMLMEDMGKMLISEKFTALEFAHCYTLITENESIYNMAKDFGMLPGDFMRTVRIPQFASMMSSADRLSETENRVNKAMVEDSGDSGPDEIGY